MHYIQTEAPQPNGAQWTFDGNLDVPTFGPSVRIQSYHGRVVSEVCHYFIQAGQIKFCSDSTHKLAGKEMPLPDLPPEMRDEP